MELTPECADNKIAGGCLVRIGLERSGCLALLCAVRQAFSC